MKETFVNSQKLTTTKWYPAQELLHLHGVCRRTLFGPTLPSRFTLITQGFGDGGFSGQPSIHKKRSLGSKPFPGSSIFFQYWYEDPKDNFFQWHIVSWSQIGHILMVIYIPTHNLLARRVNLWLQKMMPLRQCTYSQICCLSLFVFLFEFIRYMFAWWSDENSFTRTASDCNCAFSKLATSYRTVLSTHGINDAIWFCTRITRFLMPFSSNWFTEGIYWFTVPLDVLNECRCLSSAVCVGNMVVLNAHQGLIAPVIVTLL